jgi:hypothetical protein
MTGNGSELIYCLRVVKDTKGIQIDKSQMKGFGERLKYSRNKKHRLR